MVEKQPLLRNPVLLSGDTAQKILQRTDSDFIDAVIRELQSDEGQKSLKNSIADDRVSLGKKGGTVLRLFQPVHRTFHLVVVDVACSQLGNPRLDPKRIDSVGMVIRRFKTGLSGITEGWMQGKEEQGAWVPLTGRFDPDAEPLADKALAVCPMHPALLKSCDDQRQMSESVTRLFPMPPEVIKATGRTLFYGILPLASGEQSPVSKEAMTLTNSDVDQVLPSFLKETSSKSRVPFAGELVSATHGRINDSRMDGYLRFLQFLMIQLDIWNETDHRGARFLSLLDQAVSLEFTDKIARKTSEHLLDAARILVNQETKIARRSPVNPAFGTRTVGFVEMPKSWPSISSKYVAALKEETRALLNKRAMSVAPTMGRFSSTTAAYHVRVFARVRHKEGCPPKLHWGEPSEPFKIAAWYDNGPAAPIQIQMPPINKNFIKNLKPNASFIMPSDTFGFLRANKPQAILDGEAEEGSDDGLPWICGFNIPIITFCAMIVLMLIINLLNIVFWWLPFVRICIPFPFGKK